MNRTKKLAGLVAVAAVATWAGAASTGHEKDGPAIHRPDGLKWQDGPPSLPPGAKFVVLEGDPTKTGPFVMRAKMPDGYKVPPHTHPKPERLTVLSGTFYLGMWDRFDPAKGEEMPAGSYGSWPAGMKHFGWVKGETVIQIHGEGPWGIDYVNPADDPRNKK